MWQRIADKKNLFGLLAITLVASSMLAQEPQRDARDRGREREPSVEASSPPREGGIPRGEVLQEDQREGTEEGQPRVRSDAPQRSIQPYIIPGRSTWKLGVYANNSETGVVITRVVPRSAAWHEGLEPGDRIITVDGYQVGWVRDQLFSLGTELQRRADRDGHVTLLIQNVRNNRLLNRDVRLDR